MINPASLKAIRLVQIAAIGWPVPNNPFGLAQFFASRLVSIIQPLLYAITIKTDRERLKFRIKSYGLPTLAPGARGGIIPVMNQTLKMISSAAAQAAAATRAIFQPATA